MTEFILPVHVWMRWSQTISHQPCWGDVFLTQARKYYLLNRNWKSSAAALIFNRIATAWLNNCGSRSWTEESASNLKFMRLGVRTGQSQPWSLPWIRYCSETIEHVKTPRPQAYDKFIAELFTLGWHLECLEITLVKCGRLCSKV